MPEALRIHAQQEGSADPGMGWFVRGIARTWANEPDSLLWKSSIALWNPRTAWHSRVFSPESSSSRTGFGGSGSESSIALPAQLASATFAWRRLAFLQELNPCVLDPDTLRSN